jgi:hypothetical protein
VSISKCLSCLPSLKPRLISFSIKGDLFSSVGSSTFGSRLNIPTNTTTKKEQASTGRMCPLTIMKRHYLTLQKAGHIGQSDAAELEESSAVNLLC